MTRRMAKRPTLEDILNRLAAAEKREADLRAVMARLLDEREEKREAAEELLETYTGRADEVPAFARGRRIRPTVTAKDVERLLGKRGEATAREIAVELNVDMAPVYTVLQEMREEERVRLTGYDDGRPRWVLMRPPTPEERAAWLLKLCAENPLTQGDLEVITGCRRAHVDGTRGNLATHDGLVGIGRGGKKWRQGWYLPSEDELASGLPEYRPKPQPSKSDVTRRPRRKPAEARADRGAPNPDRSSQSRRGQRAAKSARR